MSINPITIYLNIYILFLLFNVLIDKATSINEFINLMSLYPNIVECFEILSYDSVLKKLLSLYKKEKIPIKIMSILKPKENDDIDSLFLYSFENFCTEYKKEENPIIIEEDFFFEYYKIFEGKSENFKKNDIIVKMLEAYIYFLIIFCH